MPRLYFALPGPLDQRSGGTIYDRRVIEALREDGWWVEVLEWPSSFPFPNEDDRLEVAASLAAVPDNALVLIEALGRIDDLDWTCAIAGGLEKDPETAEALIAQIAMLGLEDRVRLIGEVTEDEAAALYAGADVFALASVYEGYGMVFAEALAHGLPIVATTGGAIPEVVPEAGGLLVQPSNAEAFAAALGALVSDPARRAVLAEGSRQAGESLTGWNRTAGEIASVLERL